MDSNSITVYGNSSGYYCHQHVDTVIISATWLDINIKNNDMLQEKKLACLLTYSLHGAESFLRS